MTDSTTPTNIHATVMRRVRAIHALRSAASGIGASAIVIILSLYLIGREVFVARVWQNMHGTSDVLGMLRFFTSAFAHTQLSVQALVLLSIFSALWLLRELARASNIYTPKLAGT